MASKDNNQRRAVREFVENWTGKGYEKGESQPFWISLLRDVLGVEHPEKVISFEDQVHLDHTSFIDGYIASTKVMIEQKSLGKNLNQAIKQSDGSLLTPFQQAKRYITELPLSKHPRYVVTSNFAEFYVYDMEQPNGEPEVIKLKDLEKEYYRLSFLVDAGSEHLKKEMEVSIKAGEIVGILYDALLNQYIDKTCERTLKSLNILCVRLVFCLYAEDAGIFGKHDMFLDYLKQFDTKHLRKALIDLFKVLDTEPKNRDPYLEEELSAFPYVNGGLFADEDIEIPMFTDEIKDLLLNKASADFDWSEISPTIFGAVFESTLNPETRRKGGMHYTSIENIHKVIDPLFMDDLIAEFEEIKQIPQCKQREKRLLALQEKIAGLTFLDPACGSGNFLTETYLSLRKLENEILYELYKGQVKLGAITNPIKVSIGQFYGIEINDFAVTVAKTALWIAESQMMKKTEDIVHMDLDFLPLKTYANIVEGNALRINWEDVISNDKLNYIIGNPPFVGTKYQSAEQKSDLIKLNKDLKQLDYVTGWFKKASDFIQNTLISCAFVSTNSITQGEQVAPLWKNLNVNIDFAHRTFVWGSESNQKAQVHCVIIGFSCKKSNKQKFVYSNNLKMPVSMINGYLLEAPNIFIESRKDPICSAAQKMIKGSQPTDGGNFLLNKEEKESLEKKYPDISPYIKRYMGASDLINNIQRYCLWLKDCPVTVIRKCPDVIKRIEAVKESRLQSPKIATQKAAQMPTLFTEDRQPNSDYIILPVVSSERRRYMPVAYVKKDIIANANAQMIPNGNLYTFGIITSNVHMAWMRAICGRMKSDYAYSASIVYNNFPWCTPTDEQKAKIEKTAQGILDARALYPDCSLADLYDDLTMPVELRKAHQENDKAVMEAYGFRKRDEQTGKYHWLTESETVAELMKMYQKLAK